MSDNHKNALKTAWNDVTGDKLTTAGKGSLDKYASGWEGIFGKKIVDKNTQDDSLFADMHNRKEDFSLERAFASVQSRLPRNLEACLCVACGEALIYGVELKHNPIHCPHCECLVPVYFEVDNSAVEQCAEDYMCPNCVTPWKCNGPHIDE